MKDRYPKLISDPEEVVSSVEAILVITWLLPLTVTLRPHTMFLHTRIVMLLSLLN